PERFAVPDPQTAHPLVSDRRTDASSQTAECSTSPCTPPPATRTPAPCPPAPGTHSRTPPMAHIPSVFSFSDSPAHAVHLRAVRRVHRLAPGFPPQPDFLSSWHQPALAP